jgi:hypothetical protein
MLRKIRQKRKIGLFFSYPVNNGVKLEQS